MYDCLHAFIFVLDISFKIMNFMSEKVLQIGWDTFWTGKKFFLWVFLFWFFQLEHCSHPAWPVNIKRCLFCPNSKMSSRVEGSNVQTVLPSSSASSHITWTRLDPVLRNKNRLNNNVTIYDFSNCLSFSAFVTGLFFNTNNIIFFQIVFVFKAFRVLRGSPRL